MIRSEDGTQVLQIVKSANPLSFDKFYEEKKKVADQVSTEGIEIMQQHYHKYAVAIVELPVYGKVAFIKAEKDNGEIGISYQLLSGGYEYDLNFIYKERNVADEHIQLRQDVVKTFKIN